VIRLVTGTDTGVGKTVVTAAVAAAATRAGLRVAVVKPGQTGTADGEEPDAAVVARLAAPATARSLADYPDPLAPLAAARVSGLPALRLPDVVAAVRDVAAGHDLTLVEGAGGLLVPMGQDWTVAELATELTADVVLVARAGLGTLNHTALTLEALARRRLPARVVVGAWPARPELVHRTNLADLPGDLAGVVPEGAGALPAAEFRAAAPRWLAPPLWGTLDPVAVRAAGAR
jgi:dethiobiotin synthetase